MAGAALAGAMLVVADIVEGPRREQPPIVVETSGEPGDVDRDGFALSIGAVAVAAPPLARLAPLAGPVVRAARRERR